MLTFHRSYFQAIVDRWHHIAVVYDGKTVVIYVDNSKTTLGALTGTLHLQSNAFGNYTKLHIIYLTAFSATCAASHSADHAKFLKRYCKIQ